MPRPRPPHVLRFEPVLGTLLEVQVSPVGPLARRRAERAAQDLVRGLRDLEAVFSVHGVESELDTWRRGPVGTGPETLSAALTDLLRDSLRWQSATGGAYNPAVGACTERWRRAAAEGVVPTDDELTALAASIAAPRYLVHDDGGVERLADCSSLVFDAFAKGRCIDLAVAGVRRRHRIRRLVVNLGGDLVHRGHGTLRVGIEDPARPYDNEPPLAVIDLHDCGLATSGSSRRGFEVDGRWYSHIIDPRTARPVEAVPSATAVAGDVATADVLATLLGVLSPEESLALVALLAVDESLVGASGLACCVVVPDGRVVTDAAWDALAVSGS